MKEFFYLSNETGIPLLKFLWKWKLVSTAGLAVRFFPHMKHPFSAYNYLNRMRRAHYLTTRTDEEGRGFLWALDRSGFDAIRHHLPELREEGYKSEFRRHDWLASAFHMGEWLVAVPAGVQTLSEQQLRRLEPEHYPEWAPRSAAHRPDGYWHRMDSGTYRTVALEMELNRKKAAFYQGIGSFYGESAQVGRVLWVVPTLSDAVAIKTNLDKAPGSRVNIHSFVFLRSFLKQGWSALIEYGPGKGFSVETFLTKALCISQDSFVVPLAFRGTTMALLETRIKRFQPVTYGHEAAGRFSGLTTTSVVASPASHDPRPNIKPEVLS